MRLPASSPGIVGDTKPPTRDQAEKVSDRPRAVPAYGMPGWSVTSCLGPTLAAMSEQPAVRVEGVRKRFGTVQALDGVSLEVPPDTVLGLLGPHGAGKTTMVRILTNLLLPD